MGQSTQLEATPFMVTDNDRTKILSRVLGALDNLISNNLWENSLFFRAIRKRLEVAREQFQEGLELAPGETGFFAKRSKLASQREGMLEVYMALYVAEGVNIKRWEILLNTLGSHAVSSVSRPIYKNEQDVREFIRTKEVKQNDAYVAVYVNKDMIRTPYNRPPVDRHGRELMVLREGAIRAENIIRFVHVSGVYDFIDGKLIRKENASF